MTIYFVIYSVFLVFALVDLFISKETKKSTVIMMTILGITMVVFAGLRWETGTDWQNYLYYFTMIVKYPKGTGNMEIGYEFLVRSFRFLVGDNYTIFLFLCASILISVTYKAVFRLSPYPLFSLFLLLSYSVVGSSFGVRQDLSICISLLSFIFIQERSLGKFSATLFLAFLLHKSAIVFFPAYFIYKMKWTVPIVLVILFCLVFSFYMSGTIIQTLGPIISERKTEFYMEMDQEMFEDPLVALAKGLSGRLLFLTVLIPMVSYGQNGDKNFNGAFNIYVFGIILYTIFTPINPIFSRLARSYDIFQILVIPYAYYNANRLYKIALISVIFAFSIFKFSSSIRNDPGVIVPYKTVLD